MLFSYLESGRIIMRYLLLLRLRPRDKRCKLMKILNTEVWRKARIPQQGAEVILCSVPLILTLPYHLINEHGNLGFYWCRLLFSLQECKNKKGIFSLHLKLMCSCIQPASSLWLHGCQGHSSLWIAYMCSVGLI